MTPDERTGPHGGSGPVGERRDAAQQSTADPRLATRCAPGLGLSIEADLLAQAAAEGRPLDAAQLDRVVYGQCVEVRPLGEVPR